MERLLDANGNPVERPKHKFGEFAVPADAIIKFGSLRHDGGIWQEGVAYGKSQQKKNKPQSK